MNVLIICSSSVDNPYYGSIARSISNYLAKDEHDLVFGASSNSMMGICYDEFVKHNREVYAFTTDKYVDDLKNLRNSKCYVKENTFDMKKDMYKLSDMIVVLPGGIGTISEILSYIEENRSGNRILPIEIYDEDNYYNDLLVMLDGMKEKGFISEDINNYFNISHNKNEFDDHIKNIVYSKKLK